jgi:hypothetical protein
MSRVGFEAATPVLEREKTVHVLDRAATVIGTLVSKKVIIFFLHVKQKQNYMSERMERNFLRWQLCFSWCKLVRKKASIVLILSHMNPC